MFLAGGGGGGEEEDNVNQLLKAFDVLDGAGRQRGPNGCLINYKAPIM